MARQVLPVNFQDDVLSTSMNGKRRYRLLQQSDGTYILEDVTTYDTVGSTFGASQINQTNQAVNQSADKDDVLVTMEEIEANTDNNKIAGANTVKQLSSELYQSTIATSEMTLINAIGYVCDNCILLDSSGRGTFLCTEGWYDYDIVKSSGDNCSGIINGHGRNNRETYSVFKETGADAVPKKLGNATFSMTWHHNAQANVVAGLYSSIDLPGGYDTLKITPKTMSPSNTAIAFKVNGETKQTITSAGATIDLTQYNADIIRLEIFDPYNGRVEVVADIELM